jgi:hypothetical protein
LKKHHPTILFELVPDHLRRHGCEPQTLFRLLAERGYRLTDVFDAPVDPGHGDAVDPLQQVVQLDRDSRVSK